MGPRVPKPDDIRLAMLGMTEGNGHPYSWSAIFNGYDRDLMTRECPFAGIPQYLNTAAAGHPGYPRREGHAHLLHRRRRFHRRACGQVLPGFPTW